MLDRAVASLQCAHTVRLRAIRSARVVSAHRYLASLYERFNSPQATSAWETASRSSFSAMSSLPFANANSESGVP